MALSAEDKISKAKTYLVISHPFFAIFVLKLRFHQNNNMPIPTMATDGKSIYYDEGFISKITTEELIGVIVHEIEHIILLHHLRMENREQDKWNIATDLAINPQITNSGFKLPDCVLNEPKYRGMEAEKIYNLLPQDKQMQDLLNAMKSGASVGGVIMPTNKDGSALSKSQTKEMEVDVKTTIVKAAQIAKKRDCLPAGFERFIKDLLEPKVNWRSVLQEFVTQVSRNDYSWRYPNRRYIQGGLYLPILEQPELGELVVAIDTSGSLSEEELTEIASEIKAIMATYNVKIYIIYCDAAVHPPVVELDRGDDVKLKMRGGGGTDYVPVFKYIEKHGIEPVCLLYFTDGYCNSFPKNIPDYKTLWVLTEKSDYFKNPFGETTYIRYGKD